MGETIGSERVLPAVTAAAGSVQPGRFIGRASDRREGNKNQIGKPYLIPLRFLSLPRLPPHPPSSCFSFPLSLLFNCFHGREETDMDTALISDTGKHFYLFLPHPPLVFQSSCPYTWFLDAPCWYFGIIESIQLLLSQCEDLG